jgi:hypothetical protein
LALVMVLLLGLVMGLVMVMPLGLVMVMPMLLAMGLVMGLVMLCYRQIANCNRVLYRIMLVQLCPWSDFERLHGR